MRRTVKSCWIHRRYSGEWWIAKYFKSILAITSSRYALRFNAGAKRPANSIGTQLINKPPG
jgi:hypothetical protein